MKSMATDDNVNIYYELDSFSDKDKDINLKHISNYLLEDISVFTNSCFTTLNEINSLLINNNI